MTISRPPIMTTGSWPDSMVRKNVNRPKARRSSGAVYDRHFSKIERSPAGATTVFGRPDIVLPSAATGRAIRGCVIRLPCPMDFTTPVHDPALLEVPVPRAPRPGREIGSKRLTQSHLRVRYVADPGPLEHFGGLLGIEHGRALPEDGEGAGEESRRADGGTGYRQHQGPPRRKTGEDPGDAAVVEDLRVRDEEGLAPPAPGDRAERGGRDVLGEHELDPRISAREDGHDAFRRRHEQVADRRFTRAVHGARAEDRERDAHPPQGLFARELG